MNLRILKKLSKRAAPLLPLLGDHREQFRAERFDNFTKSWIGDRKHWDRAATVWKDLPESRRGRICYRARNGRVMVMSNDYVHPRKGTIMVGATSGYYEPEWDEETAWDSLRMMVMGHFTDYRTAALNDTAPRLTRKLNTPSEIFQAAKKMIDRPTPPPNDGETDA